MIGFSLIINSQRLVRRLPPEFRLTLFWVPRRLPIFAIGLLRSKQHLPGVLLRRDRLLFRLLLENSLRKRGILRWLRLSVPPRRL